MDYAKRRCVPCDAGTPRLSAEAVATALRSLDGWDARLDSTRIHRHWRFADFAAAMRFVNALAALAEAEGHHPDFTVHSWNQVEVMLWTHVTGGVSENDLIVAAKLDRLPESRGRDPRASGG